MEFGESSRAGRRTWAWVAVAVAVAGVVLARVPFLSRAPSPDEAGFMVIGGQWAPGTSLYGDQWVDRPPLLIALNGIAQDVGGVIALRWIGIVACVLVVLAVAWTAAAVRGHRAAAWGAPLVAALCVSELMGAQTVNGELLAAPFVALGLGATVHALRASRSGARWGWSALVGAAGVCAVLVKQNMVDVGVFALTALAVSLIGRRTDLRAAWQMAAGAAVGALAVLAVTAAATLRRGTDLGELWYALYRFRLDAAEHIGVVHHTEALAREQRLVEIWWQSGLAAATAVVVVGLIVLRRREPVLVALVVLLAFDAWSIAAGGSWWLHYLIQLVVPLSVGFGIVAARATGWRVALAGAVTVWVVAASGFALTTSATPLSTEAALRTGTALAGVAHDGDTALMVRGGPQVLHASGLRSVYPYLWGLPARTLDPEDVRLRQTLAGPQSPTWVVVMSRLDTSGEVGQQIRDELHASYRQVASLGPHRIWLRRTVERPVPRGEG